MVYIPRKCLWQNTAHRNNSLARFSLSLICHWWVSGCVYNVCVKYTKWQQHMAPQRKIKHFPNAHLHVQIVFYIFFSDWLHTDVSIYERMKWYLLVFFLFERNSAFCYLFLGIAIAKKKNMFRRRKIAQQRLYGFWHRSVFSALILITPNCELPQDSATGWLLYRLESFVLFIFWLFSVSGVCNLSVFVRVEWIISVSTNICTAKSKWSIWWAHTV